MALLQSPLGQIKQKIGNLRFSTWKGKNVIAQQPTSYRDANTGVQEDNRTTFKQLSGLCSLGLLAIRIGFKSKAVGVSEANVFMSVNKKQFAGESNIGFPLIKDLKVSTGTLLGLTAPIKTFNAQTGSLKLDWANNTNGVNALASDVLNVFAFDYKKNVGGSAIAVAGRSAVSGTMLFPSLAGSLPADVIVIAFFSSSLNNNCSPSQSV